MPNWVVSWAGAIQGPYPIGNDKKHHRRKTARKPLQRSSRVCDQTQAGECSHGPHRQPDAVLPMCNDAVAWRIPLPSTAAESLDEYVGR
jgi:hypothetical protein